MAKAAAVIGLVASIASLVDLSAKVVSRLDDFTSKSSEVPESFRSLSTRLPLLTAILQQIQSQAEDGRFSGDMAKILKVVVDDTSKQLSDVQSFLSKVLLQDGASKFERASKVLKSMAKEDKVQRALERIDRNNATLLDNLSNYLSARYEREARLEDLTRAIENIQIALELTPTGNPDRAQYLSNLSTCLSTRYKRVGRLEDLIQAIEHSQKAVYLTPTSDPNRAQYLSNLSTRLSTRYERAGMLEDLTQAIEFSQESVYLTPAGSSARARRLNTLSNCLSIRYKREGRLEDLTQAIEHSQVALELTSAGNPNQSIYLNNLSNRLSIRYEREGRLEDLIQAIEHSQKAVYLTPAGNPDRAQYLSNLSTRLSTRYERAGMLKDLTQAIKHSQEAVELTSAGNPDQAGYYSNLGLLYANQGKHDEAEKMYLQALDAKEKALGPDHPSILNTVNNVSILYADQGKHDAAEKMYRRALDGYEKIMGPAHPSTIDTVNNMGTLYANQGKHDAAEKMYRRALDGYERILGPDHQSTLNTVTSLGGVYKDQDKIEEAEMMYQRALTGYENAFGREHTLTLSATCLLGSFYLGIRRLESAERFFHRASIGYTRSLGAGHSCTQNAFRCLHNVRTLRHPEAEKASICNDSDSSSTESPLEDDSQLPSSASSVSAALPQAKTVKYTTELAHLFQKDEDIRATIWKALERSKDELRFDRQRVERAFTKLLRRYSTELYQSSNASLERQTARFLRSNSRSLTTAVFEAVQPVPSLQHRIATLSNQPVVKLMLDRFFEDAPAPEDASRMSAVNDHLDDRQVVGSSKDEESSGSSDGSEASHDITVYHSVEMVEAFITSGEPFANLKRRFRNLVERGSLEDVSNEDEVRDNEKGRLSPNIIHTDSGLIQVQWRCRCGHQFREEILEHRVGAAEEFIRHVQWDYTQNMLDRPHPLWWLEPIVNLAWTFWHQIVRLHERWAAPQIPRYNSRQENQYQLSTAHRQDIEAPVAILDQPSHLICVCIRHISRTKYLHHVKADKKLQRPQPSNKDTTDQDTFKAIQKYYFSVRPWWRRLLICARLSLVQYYEFKLFHNPENEVIIEEDWKDRFPQNHLDGEWVYSPNTRDTTPYLHDSVLSHYVRNPKHAPLGDYLWKRIPKKVRGPVSCYNDPECTGWGLVMNEEWHQTAFLVFWSPILVAGAVGSGLYCYYTGKAAAIGFSMFGGVLGLIVWFYQLAQAYAKQGALL